MKNITLSAEESLIQKAREKAQQERRSLNKVFREFLERYVGSEDTAKNYRRLMKKLSYAKTDRKFTRDELNER